MDRGFLCCRVVQEFEHCLVDVLAIQLGQGTHGGVGHRTIFVARGTRENGDMLDRAQRAERGDGRQTHGRLFGFDRFEHHRQRCLRVQVAQQDDEQGTLPGRGAIQRGQGNLRGVFGVDQSRRPAGPWPSPRDRPNQVAWRSMASPSFSFSTMACNMPLSRRNSGASESLLNCGQHVGCGRLVPLLGQRLAADQDGGRRLGGDSRFEQFGRFRRAESRDRMCGSRRNGLVLGIQQRAQGLHRRRLASIGDRVDRSDQRAALLFRQRGDQRFVHFGRRDRYQRVPGVVRQRLVIAQHFGQDGHGRLGPDARELLAGHRLVEDRGIGVGKRRQQVGFGFLRREPRAAC